MTEGDPAPAAAHTVITTAPDGTPHVQHYGAAHVIPESVQVIDVPPGVTVIIRHLEPAA